MLAVFGMSTSSTVESATTAEMSFCSLAEGDVDFTPPLAEVGVVCADPLIEESVVFTALLAEVGVVFSSPPTEEGVFFAFPMAEAGVVCASSLIEEGVVCTSRERTFRGGMAL